MSNTAFNMDDYFLTWSRPRQPTSVPSSAGMSHLWCYGALYWVHFQRVNVSWMAWSLVSGHWNQLSRYSNILIPVAIGGDKTLCMHLLKGRAVNWNASCCTAILKKMCALAVGTSCILKNVKQSCGCMLWTSVKLKQLSFFWTRSLLFRKAPFHFGKAWFAVFGGMNLPLSPSTTTTYPRIL